MKVVVPKDYDSGKPKSILPIIDEEKEKVKKEDLRTFEVYSIPGDATSTKYKVSIAILHGTESVRHTIQWTKDLNQLMTGLNLTNNQSGKVAILMQLVQGTAKTAWQDAEANACAHRRNAAAKAAYDAEPGNNGAKQRAYDDVINNNDLESYRNNQTWNVGIHAIIKNVCPPKVLNKVKRDLRRNIRKPLGMNVREYFTRFLRINHDELPFLPPFGNNQSFQNDEVNDIILQAVPKSWTREMDRQGRDPDLMDPHSLISFFEQIETSEEYVPEGTVSKKDKGKGKNGKSNNSSNGGGSKTCAIHGKTNHSTDECRTIKRLRSENSSGNNNGGSSGGSKNKTWSRKSEDNKKKAKNDLNAIIEAQVEAKVAEMMTDKKRKLDEDSDSSDSGDDEAKLKTIEDEINAIDMNGFDLDDIKKNVDKMETEDGEVSV